MLFLDNISSNIDSAQVSESRICSPESLVSNIDLSRTALTLMHTNIRSVACNYDNLMILLERICIQCDILVLTECWLSKCTAAPEIDGYTSYTSDHLNQNDGVILYIKSEIKHRVTKPSMLDANCLILQSENDYAVVAVYRSPSNRNINNFSDSLDLCLSSLESMKSVVLIGDININISPSGNDPNCSIYLDQMAYHGLLPAHVFPTRKTSCLDHVMLRSDKYSATYVLDSFITDHAPLVFCLDCKIKRHTSKTTSLKIDYPSLVQKLSVTDFSPVYDTADANVSAVNLINLISQAITVHSISVTIPHRRRTIKPWSTPGLVRCIRHRDELHRKATLDPENAIARVTYTRYRNFCNNLLKKLRIAYEKNELQKNKNNPKAMWNTINKIASLKKISPPPSELLTLAQEPCESVNVVNDYFAGIGETLANAILNKQSANRSIYELNKCNLSQSSRDSMVLLDTDFVEMESIILNLKSDSATGIDNIPTLVIKSAKGSLISPLTHMCNLCLTTGVFPNILKRALVHPIYKSGDRDIVGNYRPISVLTVISKILEKLLNSRLTNFLRHNNVFADNQFGFMKGRSTEDATLLLSEVIAQNLDAKKKVIGVFLDMSKAFDTVSVSLLLSKMESLGIRGIALEIFRSYLSSRTQCVRIGSYTSSETSLSFGVPQGSVLGPTLFLLYINSLCLKVLPNCNIITYADDTALIVQGNDWKEAQLYTEHAIRETMTWLNDNLLTLNVEKTRYITFTHRDNTQPPPEFYVKVHSCDLKEDCDCPKLTRTTNIKYLGLIIDNSLKWNAHITQLIGRIRKLMPVFKKLRKSADRETLLCVYHALAQSLLQYCVVVWGGVGKTILLPLERAQRAILKVMLGRPRRYSTDLLYSECSVLTVRQLYIFSTIIRKHKTIEYIPISKRDKTRVCSGTPHRTVLARQQYYVASNILYNVANRFNNIYALPSNKCRDVIRDWLLRLNYNETEKITKS